MLVTDASWAESHPVRQALVSPYQGWRCVGWTGEVLNFYAVASRSQHERNLLPDGFVISGPDALMEIASQWEPGSFSVYVLDRTADRSDVHLCRITGIWREREAKEGGGPWLWYSTSLGELRPCSSIRLELGPRADLVNALKFDSAQVVAGSRC